MYLAPEVVADTLIGLSSALGPGCRVLMDLWEQPEHPSLSSLGEGMAARSLGLIGEPVRSRMRSIDWSRLIDGAGWERRSEATVSQVASRAGRRGRLGLRVVHLAQARLPRDA